MAKIPSASKLKKNSACFFSFSGFRTFSTKFLKSVILTTDVINNEQHQLFVKPMSRMLITSGTFQTDFLEAMLYVVFLVVEEWRSKCSCQCPDPLLGL